MKAHKTSWGTQAPTYNTTVTMLWAAACTCYFEFLWSREATIPSNAAYHPTVHLSIADVLLDLRADPKMVAIWIKAFKTDPFCKGVSIYLGKTVSEVCPVATLLSYITVRGTSLGPPF